MDLDEARGQLYGVALDDFVATRTALVKAARAGGDGGLGTEIQAMRKPTLAAWLANQLSRSRPGELDELLDLGAGLREASAALDGDRLRELNPRRRTAVEELVAQARAVAAEHGVKVSADTADRLYETLDAALVDAAAGEAVRAGRLTHAFRHAGFGVVDETGEPADVVSLSEARAKRDRAASAGAATKARAEQSHTGSDAGSVSGPSDSSSPVAKASADPRRRVATDRLAKAEASAQAADEQAARADDDLKEATTRVRSYEQSVRELTAALEEAETELRTARKAQRAAKTTQVSTARSAATARRARDAARARLDAI